jgi:hypothetical protein
VARNLDFYNGNFTLNGSTLNLNGNGNFGGNNSTGVTLNNVTIPAGVIRTASANFVVIGNFTNAGTFTATSGTAQFSGSSNVTNAALIGKGGVGPSRLTPKVTGSTSFNNVTINGGGTLNAPADNLNVAGNFVNSGTFNPNGGILTFNGITPQNLTFNSMTPFNNLIVNSGATVIETVTASNNYTLAGTLTNNGDIRETKTANTGTTAFGLTQASLTLPTGSLGSVQTDYLGGNAPNVVSNTLKTGSYWTFNAASAGTASVTLPVNTPATASYSKACEYTGTATNWTCRQSANTANSVTSSNIGLSAGVSTWTVGNYSPSTISPAAGSGQSTPVTTVFPTQLQASVVDADGTPVANASVQFTAQPIFSAGDASATFQDSGTNTTSALTNASGVATAAPFQANSNPGSYNITATVQSLSPLGVFNATNTPAGNAVRGLIVNNNQLSFQASAGATAALTQKLTLQAATSLHWTSTIKYGPGASAWLSLSAANGALNNASTTLAIMANPASIAAGTYTATLTFSDVANPANQPVVNVTLNIAASSAGVYTYYMPFLANNANGFSTYLVAQNMGTAPANLSMQYYTQAATGLASDGISSLSVHQQWLPATKLAANTTGNAILTSDQPLNVVVALSTSVGGSAYSVRSEAGNNLIAPVMANDALGGFTTQLTIFNGGVTASSVTVAFYDTAGNHFATADQTFNLPAYQSQTLDQASIGLPRGFNGWAQISGSSGSQLVGQILEQRPDIHFVAIANTVVLGNKTANKTLYAPTIFNKAYGSFYTGANIVNPNGLPMQVTVTYYDKDGSIPANTTHTYTIPAFGVQSLYAGSGTIGLPQGFTGSAVVTSSDGPIVMLVNQSGGSSSTNSIQSGVYDALAVGATMAGLPVVAKNAFGGFVTGSTILNLDSNSVTVSVQYFDTKGNVVGSENFSIAGHARQDVFAGTTLALPNNFFGSAVVSVAGGASGQIAVVTNAANSSLFYTYIEP